MDDSKKEYVAVPAPLPDSWTTRNVTQCNSCSSRAEGVFYGITATCSNPELAVRWCDYFYSDEAFLLVNYGIEGITYEMVDGKPVYTEYTTKNPDHYSWENIIYHYGLKNSFPALYKWDAQFEGAAETTTRAYGPNGFDKFYKPEYDVFTLPPQISLNQEESEFYTSTISDIQTYVSEMVPKFISGQEPLTDEAWGEYKENIENMHIQECIDILEDVYARYKSR